MIQLSIATQALPNVSTSTKYPPPVLSERDQVKYNNFLLEDLSRCAHREFQKLIPTELCDIENTNCTSHLYFSTYYQQALSELEEQKAIAPNIEYYYNDPMADKSILATLQPLEYPTRHKAPIYLFRFYETKKDGTSKSVELITDESGPVFLLNLQAQWDCHFDEWGQKICTKKWSIPKTSRWSSDSRGKKIYWRNKKTHIQTPFQIDFNSYMECVNRSYEKLFL